MNSKVSRARWPSSLASRAEQISMATLWRKVSAESSEKMISPAVADPPDVKPPPPGAGGNNVDKTGSNLADRGCLVYEAT